MKKRMLYAALAALTFAAPAVAEPLRLAQAEPGVLPPHEIVTIVRSAGLDPIDRPFLRGWNYVLHALDRDDQEVRVVVNALRGDIVRVVPMMSASRMPPRGGVTMGPWQRMDSPDAPPRPDYVSPDPRRYGARPPVTDDDDMPEEIAPRPPGSVPGAPPSRAGAAYPPPGMAGAPPRSGDISRGTDLLPPPGPRLATVPPRGLDAAPPSEPHVITAIEPGRDGMLPPPPERFPQRAAPVPEKPKPVKRAAAGPPKQAPLPKPRPADANAAPTAGGDTDGSPMPPPIPEKKPDATQQVPH